MNRNWLIWIAFGLGAVSSGTAGPPYVSVGKAADGTKRYELRAKSLDKPASGKANAILALEPVLTLFAKEQSVLTIRGDRGETDGQGLFVLSGHVELASADGLYTIRTHRLMFFLRQRRVTTPDKVTLAGPDLDGKGLGMVLDADQRKLELFGNSRLSMRLGEFPRFLIDAVDVLPQAIEACGVAVPRP